MFKIILKSHRLRGLIRGSAVLGTALALAGWASDPALAQNSAFDGFFNNSSCNNAPAGSQLNDRCANLSSGSQSSLAPTQAATAVSGATAGADAQTEDAEDRLEKQRDEEAGRFISGLSAGDEANFGRLSVFVNGRYETDDENRDAAENERGYEAETFGFQIGADYRLSDRTIIGAMFGYDRIDSEFDADALVNSTGFGTSSGDSESDSYAFTVYAGHSITDNLYVDVTGGFSFADIELSRNAVFLPSGGAVPLHLLTHGETDSFTWTIGGGIGYDFYRGPWSFGPYARFNYADVSVDGFTETEITTIGLAQTIGDTDTDSFTTTLGLRASYAYSANFGVIIPQVRFEYEHEFGNDATTTLTSFVQDPTGSTFAVTGEDPDRNYFNVGGSVLVILPNGWMPFVDYEALVGYEERSRHRITGGLRAEF